MQQIINILTMNNVDYVQKGDFGSSYYIITISDNCNIKLEYMWDATNRKYIPAIDVDQATNNKEIEQVPIVISKKYYLFLLL